MNNEIDFKLYPEFGQFLIENFPRFEILTYPDNNPRPEDLPFKTIVPESQYPIIFQNQDDVTANCLHVCGHQFIERMWYNIRVPKGTFTDSQIDFLEDIYIQSVVSQIAPKYLELYPQQLLRINAVQSFDPDIPPMKLIIEWLHSTEERLNTTVFEKYCFLFSKLFKELV
jgi:hypothetical protein